jgi:hypothetical protein
MGMDSALWTGLIRLLPLALAVSLAGLLWSAASESNREVLVLQIRVLRGEGLVAAAGAKAPQPLEVQVSDETGRPVRGATVSFRLPEEGPSGVFRGGIRSDVAVTGPDGRAVMGTVVWNRTPGPLQVKVVAAKDRARAGIIVPLYLSENSSKHAAAAR